MRIVQLIRVTCAAAAAMVFISAGAIAQYDSGVVKTQPAQAAAGTNEIYGAQNALRVDLQAGQENSIYTKTVMLELKSLDAAEVEPFVRKSLSSFGTVSVNSQANMLIITDREPKLGDLVQFVKKMDDMGMTDFVQLDTEVIRLANVQASNIVSIISKRLTGEGTVQADDNLNVLIVTDVKGKIALVKGIVEELDLPPQQVIVEARIVQVSDTDFSDVGIDLDAMLDQGVVQISTQKNSQKAWPSSSTNNVSNVRQDASRVSVGNTLDEVVNMLIGTGRAKIIATPRVVTLNNKTGSIRVDTSYPYYSNSSFSYPDIELSVTPHVGSGSLMNIELKASAGVVSLPGNSTTEPSGPVPSTRRVVESTIIMKKGETFVVGGFDYEYETATRRKTPLFGDIPVLGSLFSEKIKYNNRSKVLFFITPKLVEGQRNLPTAEEAELGVDEE